jgi:hypothetical protein
VGLIHLDYSSFAVEGNPNLSLVIYNPSTEIDKKNVHALLRLSTVVGFAV